MMEHDRIRLDLCCAARLLYRNGLSAANAGHISVAIGGNRMLVNHFGPSFATLRPQNVVVVDFSGKVVEGNAYVNDTIRLHGIIHRENPHVTVVMHTHPPAVVTFSAFRKVPEVFDRMKPTDERILWPPAASDPVTPISPQRRRGHREDLCALCASVVKRRHAAALQKGNA